MTKVLVVEDDLVLLESVINCLEFEHYQVEAVSNGREAMELLRSFPFGLLILDWDVPEMSGVEICKEYRERGGNAPILMLTGKNTVDDKEMGLDAGADDYLTKPFHPKELMARVRALLRRPVVVGASVLKVGDFVLDPRKYSVTVGNKNINLPPKEFALLEIFMRNPNQVFSSDALFDRVWSSDSEASPRSVRVYIQRLREKLGPAGAAIENLHGVGYILKVTE